MTSKDEHNCNSQVVVNHIGYEQALSRRIDASKDAQA